MLIFPHQQAEKSLQNQHVLSILQVGSHQLQYRFFSTNKPKSRYKTNTFWPLTHLLRVGGRLADSAFVLVIGALHPIRRQCTPSDRVQRLITGAVARNGCSGPCAVTSAVARSARRAPRATLSARPPAALAPRGPAPGPPSTPAAPAPLQHRRPAPPAARREAVRHGMTKVAGTKRSRRLTVGVAGFEPTASSSRTKRATKLRHTPVPFEYSLTSSIIPNRDEPTRRSVGHAPITAPQ